MSAAAVGAAFGLDGPLELVRPAFAQGKDFTAQGFAKFKVGDWNVTAMFDGFAEVPVSAAFVKNASIDDVNGALKAAGLPEGKFTNPYIVTVIEKDGQIILFDSGTGGGQAGGPNAGLLDKQNMKAAGIDPAKVSKIFLTHFHPDHIFGLMAKDTNAQTYPNVEIVAAETEYKFWTDPAVIEKLPEPRRPLAQRIQATIPTWKNVRQVGYGAEVAPGIRTINTNGHSPGHMSYEIASGNSKLIVSGDVATFAALFLRNPGWQAGYDQDGPLAEKSRRALFDQVVSEGATVTGYHWPMPGAGTIKKDGSGYALVPVAAA